MRMKDICSLISTTYALNTYGVQEPTETSVDVYCSINSVTQTEFFEASQTDLKPAYQVKVWAFEYSNQQEIEIDGVRYSVYRTYLRSKDIIELYVEKKVGVISHASES